MSSITPTSNNSSFVSSQFHTKRDKEIQALMQRKTKLSEDLQTLKTNEQFDPKTKAERVKSITSSIAEVDTQIARIRAEELQEKNKPKQPETIQQQQNNKPNEENQLPSMDHLIKHSQTYDQLGKLVGMRERMDSSIKTIEGETKFDRLVLEINAENDLGKSEMLANSERTVFQKKREVVQDIQSQIHKVDQKLGELIEDIHKPSSQTTSMAPSTPASEEHTIEDKQTGETSEPDQDSSLPQDQGSSAHPPKDSATVQSYTPIDVRI
ncbi:hypothetical protein [Paenibacillus xylanexedens]|uniref:hypothetical protein n=1 Tax=Paenibacillus xylanexedens TaxID=528191 RepID=UPI0011A3F719|nr:hypothetical protein [Paenibacillus xylanexedens]